ncbi:MAG: hypothetical protein ABIJ09_04580 [Pseudomonadota bacterium]
MPIKEEKNLDKLPAWAEPTLQGLAFWMGYRQCLFHQHDLPEGALVAEACGLIQGRLAQEQRLMCEVGFSSLRRASAGDLTRADLVVYRQRSKKRKKVLEPEQVIEFKRFKANRAAIEKDLERLARVKADSPWIRCFSLVAAESGEPPSWLKSKDGKARQDRFEIGDRLGKAKVRRICRAMSSTQQKARATHCVCLIEVLPF